MHINFLTFTVTEHEIPRFIDLRIQTLDPSAIKDFHDYGQILPAMDISMRIQKTRLQSAWTICFLGGSRPTRAHRP